jgi:hypothetical protein
MTMINLLFQYLKAGPTLAGDRIYPVIAPDKSQSPYVVYQVVFSNSENVLDGSTGLVNTRIQFDVYAKSYQEVKQLFAQLDSLMNLWSIKNVSLGSSDGFESAVKLYRVTGDYSIWHT